MCLTYKIQLRFRHTNKLLDFCARTINVTENLRIPQIEAASFIHTL